MTHLFSKASETRDPRPLLPVFLRACLQHFVALAPARCSHCLQLPQPRPWYQLQQKIVERVVLAVFSLCCYFCYGAVSLMSDCSLLRQRC